LVKDIDCLEKFRKELYQASESIRKMKYAERQKELGLYSLKQKRLRGHSIETSTILTGKERINPETFSQLSSIYTMAYVEID